MSQLHQLKENFTTYSRNMNHFPFESNKTNKHIKYENFVELIDFKIQSIKKFLAYLINQSPNRLKITSIQKKKTKF